MAGEVGQADPGLIRESAAEPPRREGADHPLLADLQKHAPEYSFFQAVRLAQTVMPDAARIGHQGPPDAEALRFRPALDLAFASSDLHSVGRLPTAEGVQPRFRVTANFLGVYGPDSPLPAFYTEDLMGQEDGIPRAFLDLFHHRLYSLFYRVWEKYRASVQLRADGTDYYSNRLMLMLGLGLMPQGSSTQPLRLLAGAGLLGLQPHSAAALEGALRDYFEGINVNVDSLLGGHVDVPRDQRNRLGGANCALGRDFTLGSRVYSADGAFSVGVGPLGLEDFMAFLPSGTKMAQIREITDLFNTDTLDYEIVLRIRGEEAPPLSLSGRSANLGWSSWLGKPAATQDAYVRFMVKGWTH